MIEYTSRLFSELTDDEFNELEQFVSDHCDPEAVDAVMESLPNFRKPNWSVNIVLAKDGSSLVGFYTWRALVKTIFAINTPELIEEIQQRGLDENKLYATGFLATHSDYRRQGISSAMSLRVQQDAMQDGYYGRVHFFYNSDKVKEFSKRPLEAESIILTLTDLYGGSIEIRKFA